ncbi:MAG: PolC-type DNA polymerase III [Sandaracinaceae bacterium]
MSLRVNMLPDPSASAPPPASGGVWDRAFDDAAFVWLDLEMTGLDPVSDRICELAALRVEGGVTVAKLTSLVRPGVPVGASEAVHTLSDAMLAEAPPLTSLRAALRDLLDGAVLVGHAIRYDLAFLSAAAGRGEIDAPPVHALDTRMLARRCWHRGSYALSKLTAELGLAIPTHRAEADAVAAGQLLEVVRHTLKVGTARHLLQAQTRDAPPRFRDDVHAVLSAAHPAKTPVRFAYRVPGRDPIEDVLHITALTASHVDGHLVERGLKKTLRGDRMLWAEPVCDA